jgi:hypothetical protein
MRVDVHIERVTLDGIALTSAESAQLLTVLRRELTYLLSDRSSHSHLTRGGAAPFLRGPDIRVPGGTRPAHLGVSVARSVHASLHTGTSP